MTVGQNTLASEKLRSFVERIELVNAEIKDLQEDRTAIFAELGAYDLLLRALLACVGPRSAAAVAQAGPDPIIGLCDGASPLAAEESARSE